MSTPVPSPEEVLHYPERARDVPPEAIPAMLGDLEQLKATLLLRLLTAVGNGQSPVSAEDRLLDVEEAARKLAVSKDWLYRRSRTLPFTVRPGPRQLRFSEQGLERWIRQRQGR